MEAFTVLSAEESQTLRARYQPLSGYRLLLVPVLGTAPGVEPIVFSAEEDTDLF